MSTYKRIGLAAVSAATLVAVAGCQGSGTDGKAAADKAPRFQSRATAIKTLTAAYEKTAEAKSAKVEMTMSMPAGLDGGGDMKMSGVMGWDPTVLDMTMSGSALSAGDPDAPEQIRMVMRDNVMYMDMGKAALAEMDGKRWMKMDFGAMADKMAEEGADPQLQKALTGGMENMNQDPAQQMALLLESENLKHLGTETVAGQKADHYKGKLTVAEMLESNDSLDFLEGKDREELLKNMEKSGIKGYDTEVWVNKDGYPVKMDVGMESPEGTVEIHQTFSDYGAKAQVEVPPASQTFDVLKMLEELEGLGLEEGGLEG
ncbi:hypothetical protein [Streptomyces sp. N35]|uniref:hypothetical protein n=1 Tax=Streptomyces sp. N35 TaxID=2795730 RepID=UPI0018F52153|nr:hypothetical protein [Streptomyces sp. N35]